MARKRFLFLRYLQSILKSRLSTRSSIIQIFFVFLTTLICTISVPIFVKATTVNPIVSSSEIRPYQNLLEQGKALYDAGQFNEAVKVLKQVAYEAEIQQDGSIEYNMLM